MYNNCLHLSFLVWIEGSLMVEEQVIQCFHCLTGQQKSSPPLCQSASVRNNSQLSVKQNKSDIQNLPTQYTAEYSHRTHPMTVRNPDLHGLTNSKGYSHRVIHKNHNQGTTNARMALTDSRLCQVANKEILTRC